MTASGVSELQSLLPSCKIEWDAESTPVPRTPVPGRPTRPAVGQSGDSGVQNIRSDADLDKLVARASDIRAISVSQGMLTPEGAKRLKEFPSLQLLFFNDSFIDDSVLEAISDHPSLAHLSLSGRRSWRLGTDARRQAAETTTIGVVANCSDFCRATSPGKCPLATGTDTHGVGNSTIKHSRTSGSFAISRILPSTAGQSRTRV